LAIKRHLASEFNPSLYNGIQRIRFKLAGFVFQSLAASCRPSSQHCKFGGSFSVWKADI